MRAERRKTSEGKDCNFLLVKLDEGFEIAVSLRLMGLKGKLLKEKRAILLEILEKGINSSCTK